MIASLVDVTGFAVGFVVLFCSVECKNCIVGTVRLWDPVGTARLKIHSRYRPTAALSCFLLVLSLCRTSVLSVCFIWVDSYPCILLVLVRMWSVGFWFVCRVSCPLFAGGFVAAVMSLAVECWRFRLLVRLLCSPSCGFVDLGFSSFLSGQSCTSWPTGFFFGCYLRCS